MKIDWRTVLHASQRYESSGDWQIAGDSIIVRVSHLGDEDMEFCEGLHEVIEAYLCKRNGVTQEMVDEFDFAFEAAHQRGDAAYPCGCPRQELSDPGSDIHSPYLRQHLIAEAAEAIVARALRVDWKVYDELSEKPPR